MWSLSLKTPFFWCYLLPAIRRDVKVERMLQTLIWRRSLCVRWKESSQPSITCVLHQNINWIIIHEIRPEPTPAPVSGASYMFNIWPPTFADLWHYFSLLQIHWIQRDMDGFTLDFMFNIKWVLVHHIFSIVSALPSLDWITTNGLKLNLCVWLFWTLTPAPWMPEFSF